MIRKKISTEERESALRKTGYRCAHCGKKIAIDTATIEHIYPFSKGGSDSEYNITVLCDKCNYEKSNTSVGDIPIYYRYINKEYIEKYCNQFNKEIEQNKDDSFINYDEQSFYYPPSSATQMIMKLYRNRRKISSDKLVKIINAHMQEITLERVYEGDLFRMIKDFNNQEIRYGHEDRLLNYYEIIGKIKNGEYEAYISRMKNYELTGLIILEKINIDTKDIDNEELQKLIRYTGFTIKYSIELAIFRHNSNVDLMINDFLTITALSKKQIMVAKEDYKDEDDTNIFAYNGKYYSFPTLTYYRGCLESYIGRSKFGKNDPKDIANMVKYLLNHKDEISKKDIERYQEMFNLNNLYNQFNPKHVTHAEIKIEDDLFDHTRAHCWLLMY